MTQSVEMDRSAPSAMPGSAFDALKEIRLAVVMYGGVSLAIYINGIVQEMLKFVRATAPKDDVNSDRPLLQTPESEPSSKEKTLTSSEKVYRKLGQIVGDPDNTPATLLTRVNNGEALPIRARFMIDVLSGTSAGGINAVFLAKALANNQALEGLQQLWISQGDIEQLINDRKSLTRQLSLQNPPSSLLNSSRMYLELLSALDGMESRPAARTSPLVDQLDLFSTTTDIRGLTLPIVLADGIVYERRHRNVFHFQYRTTDPGSQNPSAPESTSFGPDSNPFLAFAARCTSAFPFAFEPMQLSDIFDVLRTAPRHFGREYTKPDTTYWERFYQDYLKAQYAGPRGVPFQFRAFGDGGYLDNKPFSYAIDAILTRHSRLPVERKLVYIEPSPEELSAQALATERPNALENSLAALLVLPRYETIREDLQRVLKRNVETERLQRVIDDVMGSLRGPDSGGDPQPWLNGTQDDHGGSYATYEALKVSSVTDNFSDLFATAFGIDTQSALGRAVRILAGEWRRLEYPKISDQRRFLLEFDIEYRLRRIRYVRRRLQEEYAEPDLPAGLPASDRLVYVQHYREELQRVKGRLGPPYAALQALLQASPLAPQDRQTVIFTVAQMELVVEPPADPGQWPGLRDAERAEERSDRGARERAKYVLTACGCRDKVSVIARAFSARVKSTTEPASTQVLEAFAGIPGFTAGVAAARNFAKARYEDFERYDSAAFPITFGTDLDDMGSIGVHRFSPDDANAREEDVLRGRPKLRGHALGAFGGFLDKEWRRNDMLWGRLDGAERLIEMVLPGSNKGMAELRDGLIDEAHEEIVTEFLELDDAKRARWRSELRAFVERVPETPAPELVARSAARATTVVGSLLEGIADKQASEAKRLFARVAFVGRLAWNFVEVSAPRSPLELFGSYWMQLLMWFCGMLIVLAIFAQKEAVTSITVSITAVTILLYAARELLRRYLRGQVLLAPSVLATTTLLGIAVFTLLGLYLLDVFGVGSQAMPSGTSPDNATQRFLSTAFGHQRWLYSLIVSSALIALVAGIFTANLRHQARQLNLGINVVRRLKFARYASDVIAALGLSSGPGKGVAAVDVSLTSRRAAAVRAPAVRSLAIRAIRMDYVFATAYAVVFVAVGAWVEFARPPGSWLKLLAGGAIGSFGIIASALNGIANGKVIDSLAREVPDDLDRPLTDPPYRYSVAKWVMFAAAVICTLGALLS